MFYLVTEVKPQQNKVVDLKDIGFEYDGKLYKFVVKLNSSFPSRLVYQFELKNVVILLSRRGGFSQDFQMQIIDYENNTMNNVEFKSKHIKLVGASFKTEQNVDPIYGKPVEVGHEVTKVNDPSRVYKVVFMTDSAIVLERNSKLLTINKQDNCALGAYGLTFKGN